uniref:Uncharacterized protein n=2 Tax=Meloidogyne incognita group TaxID=654580 RepID=A0A914N2J7_MELIC
MKELNQRLQTTTILDLIIKLFIFPNLIIGFLTNLSIVSAKITAKLCCLPAAIAWRFRQAKAPCRSFVITEINVNYRDSFARIYQYPQQQGAAILHSNWPQSRPQQQTNNNRLPSRQTNLFPKIPTAISPGKNHLQGIRRLQTFSQTKEQTPEFLNSLEHRHLRHIASQPIQQNKNSLASNRPTNVKNGRKMATMLQKARIPPKIASAIEGKEIMAMSSAEAEELALKLLQEAGVEHSSSSSSSSEEEESEEQTITTKRPPITTIKPTKKERTEIPSFSNNSFVAGSSSLLPIRKFRLIQQQRKILRDSLNRTKSTTETSTTTTTLITTPTTQSTPKTTIKLPNSSIRPQRRNGLNVPRARKLTGGHNRIVPSQSSSSAGIDEQENKNNDDQFDLASARRALLEAQLSQQKRQRLQQQNEANNQQPKPWQPSLRMLRHRHRQRLLEEQKSYNNNSVIQTIRNNKQKQQLLNRQLFGDENNNLAIDWRNRQFGIRNRQQQQNELIKDQLGKELLQLEGNDDNNEKGKQSLQLERRFRLVPNKVVFRPRLKIRRPQNIENIDGQQRPSIQLPENSAFGTEQKRGSHLPIALPSLSLFGEEPSEQPIPVPPAPGEPPPSQVATQTIRETSTTTDTTTTTTTSQPLPAPAMEVGSMGEQPPMKLEGGPPTITATTQETTTQPSQKIEENGGNSHGEDSGIIGNSGLVGDGPGPLPPGFSEAGAGFIGLSNGGEDNGLSFGSGPEVGTFPPGLKESFGLNGFVTELETTLLSTTEAPPTTTSTQATTITELQTTTTEVSTTLILTTTTELATTTQTPVPPPPPPEEAFVIPENSGLRPVAPPKEFFGAGGFGSSSAGRGGGGFGNNGVIGGSNGKSRGGWEPPPPDAQVEPPLKPEDFYTGDSALIPNKKGPDGDGYGPSASLPGSALPQTPPPIGTSGAVSGGIPMLPPFRPIPNAIGIPPVAGMGIVAPPQEAVPENEATTVKPSALLNIINKADEGFNQVITHFEQGTPLEAAAIDIMEVALGSQKLDSQAKLLSHVDRAFGLDNLQRLQRWANTGGALDLIKEQFAKIAKNYKPPQETANLFTVPPQLEYLFQNPSSGRRK